MLPELTMSAGGIKHGKTSRVQCENDEWSERTRQENRISEEPSKGTVKRWIRKFQRGSKAQTSWFRMGGILKMGWGAVGCKVQVGQYRAHNWHDTVRALFCWTGSTQDIPGTPGSECIAGRFGDNIQQSWWCEAYESSSVGGRHNQRGTWKKASLAAVWRNWLEEETIVGRKLSWKVTVKDRS